MRDRSRSEVYSKYLISTYILTRSSRGPHGPPSSSDVSHLYNPANALGLSMEEKDLLFCTRIGRWPLPLPSYLCNPANALGLSIEEKDLLFCKRIGRWPLPLPSFTLAGGWVK